MCIQAALVCVLADGKLEAIGYVAAEGKVTAPLVNAVNMVSQPTAASFMHHYMHQCHTPQGSPSFKSKQTPLSPFVIRYFLKDLQACP